jgi:hypothetical protein
MKKTYKLISQRSLAQIIRLLVLFLFALPLGAFAQSLSLTPGSIQVFDNTAVGSASPSKAFQVDGSGLAGSDVNIVIPVRFEGSTNNTVFSTSTISFTVDASGIINETIYLRFVPNNPPRLINGSVSASAVNLNGDVVASSSIVKLRGTGTAGPPSISAAPTSLSFGNQLVNTPSAAMNTTVTGSSLTAPITVTAPASFQVSATLGGTYTSSIILSPNGSGTVNASVFVRFLPTAAQGYIANVTLTSTDAASQSVGVSGTGTLPVPALTITPTSLTFTSQAVGTNSASKSVSVSGLNLQGNVTVTPPAGFQISTTTGLFTTAAIVLTPTNGTLAVTQLNVRFSPVSAQQYTDAPLQFTSKNAPTVSTLLSGLGTAATAGANINVDPNTVNFGTVTSSGSVDTRFFQVNATGLTDNLVLTPSSVNIQIRNVSAGGTFQSTPLSISPVNGVVTTQTIEAQLVSMVASGPFSQTISLTSPGTTPTPPTPEIVTVTANNTSGTISDISLVDPSSTGTDYTFVARPTTISGNKTILVSGTNLLQALTIQPVGTNAQYFQVSATGNANDFSSQLSFAPDAQGNVTQRTVYIRFVPGTAAITVTSAIRATSAPASSKEVSVTGISEPTLRLNTAVGNFGDNIVKNTKSASRTVRADGFLLGGTTVDLRFPSEIDLSGNPTSPQYEFSLDGGASYVSSASITLDAQGNFTQPLLIRYAPTRVGSAVQDLEFRNVSLNNGNYFPINSGLGQASGFAIAVEPAAQSTAVIDRPGKVADGTASTSATITFNLTDRPAGTYGQNRLVIASTVYTSLPTSLFPQDKQNFNPGTTVNGSYQFGSGTPRDGSTAGSQTGTFVVFSGGSNAFTVTNLNPSVTYYFYSFEFNDDGVLNAENYRVPNNQPAAPLPVELLFFTAKPKDGKVVLNWATATEKDNRGFAVERSADAKTFTTVMTVVGAGNSSNRLDYSAVDARPMAGLSYYRLKQTDLDGKTVFTPVVAVRIGKGGEFSLYPNPTQDIVHIGMPDGVTENLPVRLTQLTGRVVLNTRLGSEGTLNIKDLPASSYIITIGEGAQQITRRITKN